MKVYESGKIRNVGIVAHGGAGKTSLTEALLFNVGTITRLGKVDEGNTTTDYLPEEIKRKITINMAMAPIEWRDTKINLLDTPGYADFIGDVKGALRVVDGLIFTVCAVSGVEVQTEIIWEYADQANLPRLVFVNKMDRENANFYNVLDQLQQTFTGKHIVPIQLPIGAEDSFQGVIDLLEMKAFRFEGPNSKCQEISLPSESEDEAATYRLSLMEAAAEGDDELLMKYLDGEELNAEEIKFGLKAGITAGKVVPVLCGSALKNIATTPLLDVIVDYLPSPLERVGETKELSKEPLAALVFKTIADPYVGKISFFRVFEGTLKADSVVYNANKENEEKIGQLFIMTGKNQQPVTEVRAGDIAAITKLQFTTTGDTLTLKTNAKILEGIEFPVPTLSVAIQPKSKGDEDKLGSALSRLLEEDTTLKLEKNLETKETLLTGMGEMHLDIIIERLQRKFGVEVVMSNPKVPYRETIKAAVTRIEGKHKKQSGGHGQYGHVFIDLAPLDSGEFEFQETIFGGAVPKQYIPAVEKGIKEAMPEGILAGYPVTNVKVTLTDGSYHPVDSSEMAFKIAAALAFRKALEKAKPVLLEPYMNVEVTVPEQFMGDIIGDFNSKRGRILGMEPKGKNQIIRAMVPLAEMYKYAIDLKSITQGRGSFTMTFAQYEEVPQNIAEKIIEAAKVAKSS
ncbi:elongation factor G [Zhaonella formicivorans]|uniref:elongation factor G n=1 Tax=Zhaonella formicivorans TaxID=2528593 RepID=UPI0010CFB7DF|nr:elongation factor G [Zhaonella formicivorans]